MPLHLLAKNESERQKAVFDQWSPAVAAVGALTGLLGVGSDLLFIGVLGFEIGEALPNDRLWSSSSKESLANKTADVALFMAGNWIGRKIRERRT